MVTSLHFPWMNSPKIRTEKLNTRRTSKKRTTSPRHKGDQSSLPITFTNTTWRLLNGSVPHNSRQSVPFSKEPFIVISFLRISALTSTPSLYCGRLPQMASKQRRNVMKLLKPTVTQSWSLQPHILRTTGFSMIQRQTRKRLMTWKMHSSRICSCSKLAKNLNSGIIWGPKTQTSNLGLLHSLASLKQSKPCPALVKTLLMVLKVC